MKKILALVLFASFPAFGGTSAKSSKAVIPPPADPCLFTWFAGGSVGYLTEFEEVMYTLHLGTDTCWNIAGWDIALFAEIGYTEKSERYSSNRTAPAFPNNLRNDGSYNLDEVEGFLHDLSFAGNRASLDLDIIPITGNIKFERPLTGDLNAYFGAGLGLAKVDFSAKTGIGNFSDDDWVFVAQVFAGLVYNFTPNCELYGGARWIYLDDADLSSGGLIGTLDLEDDFLFEIGARYNF